MIDGQADPQKTASGPLAYLRQLRSDRGRDGRPASRAERRPAPLRLAVAGRARH